MSFEDKFNKNRKYIVSIDVLILLTFLVYFPLNDFYGSWFSVQLTVILIGSIIMISFLIGRIYNKPDMNNLNSAVAKLYFSTTSNLILAIIAGFGIAFSILWGSLYTYVISSEKEHLLIKYKINLKVQGIMLFVYLISSIVIILFTFLLPLAKQIKDNGQIRDKAKINDKNVKPKK